MTSTEENKKKGEEQLKNVIRDEKGETLKKRKGQKVSTPIAVDLVRRAVIGSRHIIDTPFGKKELVYADYTASGRCLQFVEDYMTNVVAPTYANTHTEASATGAQTTHHREEARECIRQAVNAPAVDYTVLFTGSGTTGAIEKLFRNLGFFIPEYAEKKWNLGRKRLIPENQRPVIFISHMEHHSNELIWRESFARCIVINEGNDGTPDLEHLKCELIKYSREKVPMIGSFSAGSNVTGIRSPVDLISKILHAFGAYAFFDYAGVGAYVDVDVKGNDMDAAFFSPHKFIGGPGSSGILIAKPKLFNNAFGIETTKATTPGGGTIYYASRVGHSFAKELEYREDAGTPGIMQAIRAGLAFKVKEMVGPSLIEKLEVDHCSLLLKKWMKNDNIALIGADRSAYSTYRVSIFSFNLLSPILPDIAKDQVVDYEKNPKTRKVKSTSWLKKILYRFQGKEIDSKPKSKRKFRDVILSAIAQYALVGTDTTDSSWTDMLTLLKPGNAFLPLHYNFVVALLNDIYGIQARGGCSCAGPYGYDLFGLSHVNPDEAERFADVIVSHPAFKPGWARINLNYFISHDESEFIVEAVSQIAEHGWKLLPQYVQDPVSGQYLHRTAFDEEGEEIFDASKYYSISDLQIINNSQLNHDTPALTEAQAAPTIQFPQPNKISGERKAESYKEVLSHALKIYEKEDADAMKPRRFPVADFTSDLSPTVKPEDIWWLLPSQAEKKLTAEKAKGWDAIRQKVFAPTRNNRLKLSRMKYSMM